MSAVFRDSLLRPVPWLAAFAIDEGDIDSQHWGLITLCNDICQTAAQDIDDARHRLRQIDVPALLEHHFQTEEQEFRRVELRKIDQHLDEHAHLRDLILNGLAHSDALGFIRALLRVRTGLVEHIIRHDLGLKTHLQFLRGI